MICENQLPFHCHLHRSCSCSCRRQFSGEPSLKVLVADGREAEKVRVTGPALQVEKTWSSEINSRHRDFIPTLI
ncbi:unnamed protein product [Brassica rapa subsp. narinosa]